METELLAAAIQALSPPVILLLGGWRLMKSYELQKKRDEQQVELVRTVRQKQYEAVEALYELFARFMSLYRLANSTTTDLSDPAVRRGLLERAVDAECRVDALILRIGCEFATSSGDERLERLLGNLRQSVQAWREHLERGDRLPFHSSEQPHYRRFKEAFAATAAFMTSRIHNRLEPPDTRMDAARELLMGAFSNKYERFEDEPFPSWADAPESGGSRRR